MNSGLKQNPVNGSGSIKDLVNFINCMGGKIKWIGKRTCQIIGVNSLNQTTYSVMGDRIETGTFCVLATLAKGNLIIKNLTSIDLVMIT